MWRHIASNALTFFVVGLFLLAGVILWGAREYREQGPLAQAICLSVESGTNMRAVSRDLEAQGAISSGAVFRIGSDYSEKSNQLKAGSYLVPEGSSMEQIVEIVTRGGQSTCGTEIVYRIGVTSAQVQVREMDPVSSRFVDVADFDPDLEEVPAIYTEVAAKSDTRFRVALAEGVTSWQVVTGLNAVSTLGEDFEGIPPEGSLAPDSYEFMPGDSVASIIERMTQAQMRILDEAWAERAADLPVTTKEEALILASLIEKETGLPDERRTVASVFVNRLEQGIRLQTDPAVIYGITEGKRVLGRGLRQSELRGETPYNTYVIDGLTPTPICNPGRASIEAALNPESTNYVFFVADGTGGHAFAETLNEHNRNVARWREIEREQAAAAAAAAAAAEDADSSGN